MSYTVPALTELDMDLEEYSAPDQQDADVLLLDEQSEDGNEPTEGYSPPDQDQANLGLRDYTAPSQDSAGMVLNDLEGDDDPVPELEPGAIDVDDVTLEQVELSSSSPTGGVSPYTYQWHRSTTQGFTPSGVTAISGATSPTLVDDDVNELATYYYVLGFTDQEGTTVYSGEVEVTVVEEFSPGQITIVEKSSEHIRLEATDAKGGFGPYAYQWYRSTESDFTPSQDTALEGETSLTLIDTTIEAGTRYYYIIEYTDEQDQTVQTVASMERHVTAELSPVLPGEISLVALDYKEAQLVASDMQGGIRPYIYQWHRSLTRGFAPAEGNKIEGATDLELTDQTVAEKTRYYYRVVYKDEQDNEVYSNDFEVNVPEGPETLLAGEIRLVEKTDEWVFLSADQADGGVPPYTYQWHRGTASDFTPDEANEVDGATGLAMVDETVDSDTTYHYKLVVTDADGVQHTSSPFQVRVPEQRPADFPNIIPVLEVWLEGPSGDTDHAVYRKTTQVYAARLHEGDEDRTGVEGATLKGRLRNADDQAVAESEVSLVEDTVDKGVYRAYKPSGVDIDPGSWYRFEVDGEYDVGGQTQQVSVWSRKMKAEWRKYPREDEDS